MEKELDPGAKVSFEWIPMESYEDVLGYIPLQPADIVLTTHTGEGISPEGVTHVDVKLNNQAADYHCRCWCTTTFLEENGVVSVIAVQHFYKLEEEPQIVSCFNKILLIEKTIKSIVSPYINCPPGMQGMFE